MKRETRDLIMVVVTMGTAAALAALLAWLVCGCDTGTPEDDKEDTDTDFCGLDTECGDYDCPPNLCIGNHDLCTFGHPGCVEWDYGEDAPICGCACVVVHCPHTFCLDGMSEFDCEGF